MTTGSWPYFPEQCPHCRYVEAASPAFIDDSGYRSSGFAFTLESRWSCSGQRSLISRGPSDARCSSARSRKLAKGVDRVSSLARC